MLSTTQGSRYNAIENGSQNFSRMTKSLSHNLILFSANMDPLQSGVSLFPMRKHDLPDSTLQITKRGYTLTKHSRITRRQFMAGTVAAGAALAVPWYFDTRTAFAFYQSQGLRMFVQPLRGVGPGGIPVAAPDAFLLQLPGLPTTLSTSRSSQISYTHNLVRPRCGVITRSCHWAEEHNPRSTSAAFSWCNEGRRSRSRSRTRCHRSTSCQSIPAPTFLKRRSTRTQSRPMSMVGSHPGSAMAVPFTWFTPDGQYGQSVHSSAGQYLQTPQPWPQTGAGGVLLPKQPERSVCLVPRPRYGPYPTQCLCRNRQCLYYSRQLRGQSA